MYVENLEKLEKKIMLTDKKINQIRRTIYNLQRVLSFTKSPVESIEHCISQLNIKLMNQQQIRDNQFQELTRAR